VGDYQLLQARREALRVSVERPVGELGRVEGITFSREVAPPTLLEIELRALREDTGRSRSSRRFIVEEQDLKAAVQVLNRTRKAAELAKAQSGHEMDTVDQK